MHTYMYKTHMYIIYILYTHIYVYIYISLNFTIRNSDICRNSNHGKIGFLIKSLQVVFLSSSAVI